MTISEFGFVEIVSKIKTVMQAAHMGSSTAPPPRVAASRPQLGVLVSSGDNVVP